MKILIVAAIALVLSVASPVSADEGVTPTLKMTTTYQFMFFSEGMQQAPFVERPGGAAWLLAWQGTVQGDVTGVIRWWVEFFPPENLTGVGRFEIWDCEPVYPSPGCNFDKPGQLLMAGYETFGYVSATDWEGKGIVTYASEPYSEWFGRRVGDGGYVDFYPDGLLCCGAGTFTIFDRPSNKH